MTDMNNHISLRGISIALLATVLPFAANATEFITNGSFEQGPSQDKQYGFIFDFHNPNEVTGWVIDSHWGQNVFYYSTADATSRSSGVQPLSPSFDNVANVAGDSLQPGAVQADPNGSGHFVAIDGNNLSQGDSSIYQKVTGLTPGADYKLTFDWGGVQLVDWSGPTTESMRVWLGNSPLSGVSQSTATVAEGTHYFSGWMTATMDFVAQSATEVLTFQGIGTPGGTPPMLVLDGVSMTEATPDAPPAPPVSAVPEASTWAMLLMGCAAIGGYGSRRRRSPDADGFDRRAAH